MRACINILYESSFGRILDFQCKSEQHATSSLEFSETFSINLARKGNFIYRIGEKAYDVHSGTVLLENAGCERVVTHPCATKDECTVLELHDKFLEVVREHSEAANRRECSGAILTTKFPVSVFPATPKLEYLHSSILHAT